MTLEKVIADAEEEISDCQIDLDGISELLEEYPERKKELERDIYYCKKRMDFNKQLAEWLKDYKRLKSGGWIPTAERLPDNAGFYLVTKKQKTGAVQIALGSYSPDFGWSGSGNFNNVIAWLPIPEAYTED